MAIRYWPVFGSVSFLSTALVSYLSVQEKKARPRAQTLSHRVSSSVKGDIWQPSLASVEAGVRFKNQRSIEAWRSLRKRALEARGRDVD